MGGEFSSDDLLNTQQHYSIFQRTLRKCCAEYTSPNLRLI
jgi:hypothetical protein